jgi:hypothetical protein
MADKATGDLASAPNQEATQGEGNNAPSYATVDQVAQIVNAAISSRNKNFEKKFEELMGKLAPTEPDTKPGEKPSAELSKLQKQLADLQAERESEKEKRRDLELRSSVKEKLSSLGIQPTHIKAAMAVLVDSERSIGYNEDGELVFRTPTGDRDLESGLKAWAKSEEAKLFLPPRGVAGSGEKPAAQQLNRSQGNAPTNREQVGEMLLQALRGAK